MSQSAPVPVEGPGQVSSEGIRGPTTAWATTPVRPRQYVRSRISLPRLRQLMMYHRTTSAWRHLGVVMFFAVPSVLTSLMACTIPLHDPSRGPSLNRSFWLHFFVTFVVTYVGTMAQVRAGAAIPHALFTNRDMVVVAVVSTLPFLGLSFTIATYWRFPIPFSWVVLMAPWFMCLALGNFIVLRHRLKVVGRPLLAYAPSLVVQISQLVIYPAYSALFEAANASGKIAVILFFPLIKFALKKSVFLLTRHSNRELSSEIAVSSVEICASMYQSMVMQSTPSVLATALVIGLDVLQGLVDIKRFMYRPGATMSRADAVAVMEIATALVETPVVEDVNAVTRLGTQSAAAKIWPSLRPAISSLTVRDMNSRDKASLTQTLEMLQAAETILLVEYIEVAVPLVNAVYLAVATQFESSIYNPKLRDFYRHPDELRAAIASLVLYTGLQALTLVAMAVAVQVRLKLSALSLLAFVLESHLWSLQGKMVAWLSVLFVFSVVHYGVDFSFQFDFAVSPPG